MFFGFGSAIAHARYAAHNGWQHHECGGGGDWNNRSSWRDEWRRDDDFRQAAPAPAAAPVVTAPIVVAPAPAAAAVQPAPQIFVITVPSGVAQPAPVYLPMPAPVQQQAAPSPSTNGQ
jgi:hypothetical protein